MDAMTEVTLVSSTVPRVYSWLLALLLPIFAIYPALFNAIEEHAYDAAEFHIFRGVVWSAARADGAFYPRWVQSINGGLGGPLFEFYSPLAYFLMDLLDQFGIPHTIAWRILVALSLVAASTGMFGLGLALFKRADVALLCSAIFSYNAYLLRDLFERGSPQGFTMALLPWLLWLLLRSTEKFSPARLALPALCFAAMILLHNATALLLVPVVAIFIFFLFVEGRSRPLIANEVGRTCTATHAVRCMCKRPATLLAPILALITGVALAAFYLIPYLAEIQFVQFDNPLSAAYALPAANPIRLEDILTLARAMDTGIGNNAIGEGGGLLHALALLLAIPIGLGLYRAKKFPELGFVICNLSFVILVLWLQTDSATWVWNAIPLLNVFQFRWRLLGILPFVAALTAGYFFTQLRAVISREQSNREISSSDGATRFLAPLEMTRLMAIPLLITLYVFLALPMLYPNLLFRYIQFSPRPSLADAQAFAIKNNAPGLTSFNEYLPRWRQTPITSYAIEPIANLPNGARVSNVSHPNDYLRAQIETPTQFTAALNILYYPGWVAYVDGQAQTIAPTAREGLIALEVPSGTHTLELRYEGTLAQHLGDLISIFTGIALILFVILSEAKDLVARISVKQQDSLVAMLPQNDIAYLPPRWWIPIGIVFLVALKASWVDPSTTLFRATSTCHAIQDSVAPTNIAFDNRIRMCGYALSRKEFQPNDQLLITIYWELESPAQENDFSFVHLLGEKFNPETGNPLWGQQDKQAPAEHALMDWAPGKLYRDVYAFRIAPNAPGGEYQLEMGWQDANGTRLKPNGIQSDQTIFASHLDSLFLKGIQIR